MKLKFFILLIVFIFTFESKISYCNTEENSIMKSTLSTELKATIISPTMNQIIDTHKNLIFCSTFQMAWNEICQKYAKGPLEILDAPTYVNDLNTLYKQPALLEEESYIAMSGQGKDRIIKKINEAVKNKFGHLSANDLPPQLKFEINDNDIMAFSYLYKNLEFPETFENQKPIIMDINNNIFLASAFGIKNVRDKKHLLNQVKIKYYNDEVNDFNKPKGVILSLITKSTTDELIISDLSVSETLLETFKKINSLIIESSKYENSSTQTYERDFSNSNQYFNYTLQLEELSIPKLNFNILHEYEDLKGKTVLNKSFKAFNTFTKIGTAIQKIALKLNEKGAKLSSYALIIFKGADKPQNKIIIKCPFVIYLKNKKKELPYFMAYICNDEVLVKLNQCTLDLKTHREIFTNQLLSSYIQDINYDSNKDKKQNYTDTKNTRASDALKIALKKKEIIKSIFYKIAENTESISQRQAYCDQLYYQLIENLICNNAELNIRDDKGMTPLLYAIENEDKKIIKLLQDYGAK